MIDGFTVQERMQIKIDVLNAMKNAAERRFCNAPNMAAFKQASDALDELEHQIAIVTALAMK